jgi:hypothetical protein
MPNHHSLSILPYFEQFA